MWTMEAYHPQTLGQWPDESNSIYKLLQVINMNTLWGSEYIIPIRCGNVCRVQGKKKAITCKQSGKQIV